MDIGPSPSFATLLRRYRVAAGLSQEELAERAGLGARTVSDLERGVSHAPRKDTVALLAQALALGAPERAALVKAARRLSPASSSRPTPTSTSSPLLVGRAPELALLEGHLGGQGLPVLLLAGEPGIGKTRLLQAALPRAAGHGLRVLEGGCQRRGGHEPYAPLLDALQRHIRDQASAQQRTELAGCAWLVRLLPELAAGPIEPLPAWTLPPEQEWRLMVQAVLRFLGNVAGPAGTLLVLDDLQWASPDALDLLTVLARSAAEVPLRVLGAYRDTEVRPQDPLSVMLADLAQASLATQHTLPPLTREEGGQLLAALLADVAGTEPRLQQRVLQRAGGVPFFLVSCAQALRTAAEEDNRADRVPWDVAQGLRQRVAGLSVATQEVLRVAAVMGRVVALALLMAVAAQGEQDVLAACEAACRARLLEEAGVEGYQFAHDVIREVVEADLGAARRRVLHRRIAAALEQQPGEPPVELLAYHYSRSDTPEKAVLYLEQAGDKAAAQHAHAAAEGYYRELVERLDGLGRALEAAAAREKLGAVLRTMARYDAALDVLERAAGTYRAAGDLARLGQVTAQIAWVHAEKGSVEVGVACLQALLEPLEASGMVHSAAALYAALARLLMPGCRYGEQLAAGARAVELARAVGDNRIVVEAAVWQGVALLVLGRGAEGLPLLEDAIQLAEAAGDLSNEAWLLLFVSHFQLVWGEFATSMRNLERALELAERLGDPALIAHLTSKRGLTAFLSGDWSRARADLERAVALGGQVGVSYASPYYRYSMGYLCYGEGRWAEASRYLEESARVAARIHDLVALRFAQAVLAELDLREGRPAVAEERLVPLLDRPGLEEWDVIALLPPLAWAYLELGDVAQATTVLAQGIRRARAGEQLLALVDGLRVHAMVAMHQQHWEDAAGALDEGLALARRMPYPYAEARLLHVYGEMHAQKGEPETARERLEVALAIFRRLGARRDAERVEQALTDLPQSHRPGRRP
jgi:transcriptional regulator with XRE-family HTH domain/tetratricopeptide (TPR) repeat protein